MTSITPFCSELKSHLDQELETVDLVRPDDVLKACQKAGHRWRKCFWSPRATLITFLRQILHGNCSCRQAVALTLSSMTGLRVGSMAEVGWPSKDEVSGDPSAYSQARQKLPRSVLENLNRSVVKQIQGHAASSRRFRGRPVVIVDGASVSMPDTPELQKAFPQPSAQKPGCGFPVMRLAAIFCWASGCLLEWAADSLRVSELALFRRLMDRLSAGTVVLGDTYFGSYYDLVLVKQHKLDGVFRMHQRRPTDLRFGTRLGEGDHLITWSKPRIPPWGIAAEEWEKVPQTLTVRHVQCRIDIPGFRCRQLDVVTTLLDPQACPKSDLTDLYRDRWRVELNIRSLKTTLRMEVLKGQSEDMVRKELLVYQLGYNLIRLLMWRAAKEHGVDPRRLSFAGTQQRLTSILPHLSRCRTLKESRDLAAWLLHQIAADILPDRPDRIEPRAVKRRPKNYRRLTRPRHEARRMAYFING